MDLTSFDRNKIYEKLKSSPQPENYKGKIPWTVQQQIAATNGIHFIESIGHLTEYPIPPIPIEGTKEHKVFLDIGNGWGRWLVAAAKKGYIPIGIDLRLEFCEVSRTVLKDIGFTGYTIVADLKSLPFKTNIFDVVWSFSVIQHTHRERFLNCIRDIQRILKNNSGYCYLEFPNKNGIHNRFGPAKKYIKAINDYVSWDVRYYSPGEYRDIFKHFFDNFQYFNHSALGIGVLPGDFKYVKGLKNKLGIQLSRGLSKIVDKITPLKAFSDSIYIKCYKHDTEMMNNDEMLRKFKQAHDIDPTNNLNIINLLCCPESRDNVFLSTDSKEIISEKAKLAYPIRNGIPIMVSSEARCL